MLDFLWWLVGFTLWWPDVTKTISKDGVLYYFKMHSLVINITASFKRKCMCNAIRLKLFRRACGDLWLCSIRSSQAAVFLSVGLLLMGPNKRQQLHHNLHLFTGKSICVHLPNVLRAWVSRHICLMGRTWEDMPWQGYRMALSSSSAPWSRQ